MSKIITNFVYPPIPIRSFDYVAYREGDEETGPFGWGDTEEKALTDLQYELEACDA